MLTNKHLYLTITKLLSNPYSSLALYWFPTPSLCYDPVNSTYVQYQNMPHPDKIACELWFSLYYLAGFSSIFQLGILHLHILMNQQKDGICPKHSSFLSNYNKSYNTRLSCQENKVSVVTDCNKRFLSACEVSWIISKSS